MSATGRAVPWKSIVLAAAGVVAVFAPQAGASVPTGDPTFTDPLTITNSFFPVAPGSMKVYGGRNEGEDVVVVETVGDETRAFVLDGVQVSCRVLVETEFSSGALKERTRNYFAQADDGTVWFFGELVDNYEDGVLVDHDGSFLVGGPAAGETALTTDRPTIFMPANPEVGDVYTPEDLPDETEVDTVRRVDRRVRVPAGRFEGCILVRTHEVQDDEFEQKAFAPGVGKIAKRTADENVKLLSSTLP